MVSSAESGPNPMRESGVFTAGFRHQLGRFILIGTPLVVLVIWTTLPILWAVLSSLKEPLEIYESNTLLPANPNLNGYRTVLSMRGFDSWLFNSFLVTIVATIVPLVLSILAAYGFARYAFRFRPPSASALSRAPHHSSRQPHRAAQQSDE